MTRRTRRRRRPRRPAEPKSLLAQIGDYVGGTLDSAVYTVAPGWGSKRHAIRCRRELFDAAFTAAMDRFSTSDADSGSHSGGGYRSARNTRDDYNWMVSRLSPNSELELDHPTMVERADSIYKNHDLGRGFVEGKVRRVVGTGLTVVPSLTPREGYLTEQEAARLESDFRWYLDLWTPRAGKKGEHLWILERLVERHLHRHGEAFILVGDRYDPLSPITLKIEVIHPRRVSTPDGQEGNPNIRMGIEYDDDGVPIAYHIRERHPGDTKKFSYRWIRKEANFANGLKQMIHVYDPSQSEEGRGYPAMQIGMPRLKKADEFDDAMMELAWIQACLAAFVRSEMPEDALDAQLGIVEDAAGNKIFDIEPGTVNYMGMSDKVEFSNPTTGGAGLPDYMEHQGRMFSAGVDSPYEAVANNWKGLSYSAGKIIDNSEQGSVSCGQRLHGIWLCAVYANVVNRIVTQSTGLLPPVNVNLGLYRSMPFLFDGCRVIPPRKMSIDPAREGRVELTDVEAGLLPIGDLVEQRTGRPRSEVYRAIKRDREDRREHGLETHMPGMGRDVMEPEFQKAQAASRPPTQPGGTEPGNQERNENRTKAEPQAAGK